MNSVYAQLKRRNAARRGTSLIEILVVLVILVFGILSVIRLFPAGFLVFRAAQNNGVGQRLGQSLLESVSKDTSSIADGVYIYNDALGFDPTIAPDDLTAWKTDPTNAAYSDINKARYVSNETLTLPPPRSITSTYEASVHVLNYGPAIIDGDKTTNVISVISAPWSQQVASSVTDPTASPSMPTDNPNDLLAPGQAQYLIDYNTRQIAVPHAAYPQTFVFTVTVDDGNPVVRKTVTTTVTTPVNLLTPNDSVWQSVSLTGQGVSSTPVWIPGSAILYRPFARIDTGYLFASHTLGAFSADPYEFQPRYGSIGLANANFGVLDFNPLAGGVNGTPPLKARISYMVYDWHVLHEDHSLPYSSQDRTIRLGIDNLKKTGDVQHDQTLFQGIFKSATPGQSGDLMVSNLDTGETAVYDTVTTANATDLDGDVPGSNEVGISYKSGRVTFPLDTSLVYNEANPTPNSNGVHIRLYYMGSADWGVALQKAPASYTATAVNTDLISLSPSPVNIYYATVSGAGVLTVSFPFCDYGKTVEISGVMTYSTTGSPSTFATAPIPSMTVATGGTSVMSGKSISQVVIPNVVIPANCDTSQPIQISSVRGVSADAIVVWRENDQWKHRIIDTLLPRN